jgi:hypothetical protein
MASQVDARVKIIMVIVQIHPGRSRKIFISFVIVADLACQYSEYASGKGRVVERDFLVKVIIALQLLFCKQIAVKEHP